MATDKAGYITAQGGQTYGRPAQTLVNPAVLGYKDFNAFNAPDAGDPAKAKKLLQQAGVEDALPDHVHLPRWHPDPRQVRCGAEGRPGTRPASRSRSNGLDATPTTT